MKAYEDFGRETSSPVSACFLTAPSIWQHINTNVHESLENVFNILMYYGGFSMENVIFAYIVHLHIDELGYISQWRAILAGGLAGISAALATYPLEVAETRLIAQNCREPTYRGVVHTLSKIYQTEGIRALYSGFSLTVLGAFPCSIGCYAVYINLNKLWWEPQFRFTPLQIFINGCLAAGIAQTFSYPFETVKRKRQAPGVYRQAQNPRLPHYGGAVHFTGMLDFFRQVIRNKCTLTLEWHHRKHGQDWPLLWPLQLL